MMQTTDHEQGAAIAFQLMEEGGTEDIRRYMLGLPFHAIPAGLDSASCVARGATWVRLASGSVGYRRYAPSGSGAARCNRLGDAQELVHCARESLRFDRPHKAKATDPLVGAAAVGGDRQTRSRPAAQSYGAR